MAIRKSNVFDYLISNRRFADWVKNPNKTGDYFWNKWIEEHKDFAKDFEEAQVFIKSLKFKDEELTNTELEELMGGILKQEKIRILSDDAYYGMGQKNSNWLFKAAVVLFIIGIASLVPYYLDSRGIMENGKHEIAEVEWVVISNPKAKRSNVTLPDGTLVVLNSESTLKYPKKFDQNIRRVELSGEAFFDVTHFDDYPFIVTTGKLETEVFGTTFNINSFIDNNTVDVSLVTGKVVVQNVEQAKFVKLNPGEQLSFNTNNHSMVKRNFDVETTIAWQSGYMIFKNVGFKEFVDKLERWYGVDFQVFGTPPDNWKFNGRYHNEKIEDILIGIKFVYKVDYKIQGNNVIINFK